MALKSGRVGVKKTEVDYKGKIKGSSSDLGGLKFRVTPEGQAQYKTPNGEWVNFSSGSTPMEIEIPIHISPFYISSSSYSYDADDPVVSGWIDLSDYVGRKCLVYGFSDSNFFNRGKMAMADVLPSDTEKVTPSNVSVTTLYYSSKVVMVDTNSSFTENTYPIPITADKPILSVYVSNSEELFDTVNARVKVLII